MPTVNVKIDFFNQLIGRSFTEEELERICFDFGIEVEFEYPEDKTIAPTYAFEVASNRYDLLSVEGIARNLGIYLGLRDIPVYTALPTAKRQQLIVKSSVKQVRPFACGAILRNIQFTDDVYQSFIDAQDKLHFNVGRKRTLVSMGTHDLDTVQGPFIYDARVPEDISFQPLNLNTVMTGKQVINHYLEDKKMREFAEIIQDSPVFPVILDANGVVCSLPPLINSDHSKIKLTTRNVFIEITATDQTKAHVALQTLVSMFSQYCDQPFTVEEMEVIYEETNETQISPNLAFRKVSVEIDYVNTLIGINITGEEMVQLLAKTGLRGQVKGKSVEVDVDFIRTDILHPVDLAEDIGISYGYNKIENKIPSSFTVGTQQLLNKVSDLLRQKLAQAGYTECLNWCLCSTNDNTDLINQLEDTRQVRISNPKTKEFQTCRTTLIAGLMKTLQTNKKNKLPLSLFEIGDVVLKADTETGARNERRLAAVFTDHENSGLELIHGLLDYLMLKLNIPCDEQNGYSIRESQNPTFFPGRQVAVYHKKQVVGHFGALHPTVLKKFEWYHSASILELNVEALLTNFE